MYNNLPEDTREELTEKLKHAIMQAKTFHPSVRPKLKAAQGFWIREVERLTHKIRYLFDT